MMDRTSKIYVSGAHGFLGKHVVEELRRQGFTNLLLPDSIEVNLKSWHTTYGYFLYNKPDAVIHLAANVGGIEYNRTHPAELIADNLLMAIHLLNAAKYVKVRKVCNVSSVCAYPFLTPTPFREESLWDGYPEPTNAPYGIAKRAIIEMGKAYRKQYDLNVVSVLLANLYGPGESLDRARNHVVMGMMVAFQDAIAKGEDVRLWGTGSPSRDLLYVKDAARGIVMAFDKYEGEEPVNLGTGRGTQVSELAEQISKLFGKIQFGFDSSKPSGQLERQLDTTKAKELFGFEAQVRLEDGLKDTYDWFRRTWQEPHS